MSALRRLGLRTGLADVLRAAPRPAADGAARAAWSRSASARRSAISRSLGIEPRQHVAGGDALPFVGRHLEHAATGFGGDTDLGRFDIAGRARHVGGIACDTPAPMQPRPRRRRRIEITALITTFLPVSEARRAGRGR